MRIYTVVLLLSITFFCISCSEKYNHGGKTPLVEVNGNFLYKEDLLGVMPVPISSDDSVLFAEHYIRNWVDNTLLNDKAKKNIANNKEIERLVDNYRKSLIIHSYQQALINQKLTKDIPESELQEYYENNKNLFKLDRPIVKGLFIKVPLNAPQLANVRKWYKSQTQDAIDNLEKYQFQNAVNYAYFYENWIPISEVLDLMPLEVDSAEDYINKNRQIELKDSAYYYFLNVSDFRGNGEEEPYEFARPDVVDLIVNTRQVDFLKQVKEDLYQQAVKQNKIIYNY